MYSSNYVFYLILFLICAYLILTDNSISQAFVYVFDIIKNKLIMMIWWVINNPRNPIVKYLMWKRSMKLAEELMREYEQK
jgi:hypothetical protein